MITAKHVDTDDIKGVQVEIMGSHDAIVDELSAILIAINKRSAFSKDLANIMADIAIGNLINNSTELQKQIKKGDK